MKPGRRLRASQSSAAPLAGGVPHLLFRVAADAYALRLSAVREIVGLGSVRAPLEPSPALRGVVELRGERVAVVDLGVALGAARIVDTPDTCVLVLEDADRETGRRVAFLVDAVSDVSSVAHEEVAPAPQLGGLPVTGLATALARVGERLVPILALDRLLAGPDVRAALAASGRAPAAAGGAR